MAPAGVRGSAGGSDVVDDFTTGSSHIITQHEGKLLSRVLFCEDIAGVLSDVASIGISRLWDSLIHCWRIGNVRCDDMMGVMTLFDDDHSGYSPPWWPGLSSCLCSVLIKDYSVDVVVSYLLRNVQLAWLYVMGVTTVAGVMISVATLTHMGRSFGVLWVAADSVAVGGASSSSNECAAAHCRVLLEWGETVHLSGVHLVDFI